MNVGKILGIHAALKELAMVKAGGNIAYRIAKNISALEGTVKAAEDRRSGWLKENATAEANGEYKLEGEKLSTFVTYWQSVLDEEEELPTMRNVNPETDFPGGDVKGETLLPLIGVCLEES